TDRQRVAHALVLVGRVRERQRPDADGVHQPVRLRVPRALRLAERDRLAPLRLRLRAVLLREPRHSADCAEQPLAAPFHAPLRPRRVPDLPRPRRDRRPAARAHGDPGRQRDAARRGRFPVGAVAVGRVALVAAGAVLLVLVAAACGERSEPTGAQTALYPVTVPSNAGGKALVVKTPVKRIAVIAPSVHRILLDLGAGKQIAGMPLLPNDSVDVGALRKLRPAIIVASPTTADTTLAQAAHAVPSVPVYRAPDDSIRGVEETITDLGLITAQQAGASRLVRAIEAKRATVRGHLA